MIDSAHLFWNLSKVRRSGTAGLPRDTGKSVRRGDNKICISGDAGRNCVS